MVEPEAEEESEEYEDGGEAELGGAKSIRILLSGPYRTGAKKARDSQSRSRMCRTQPLKRSLRPLMC